MNDDNLVLVLKLVLENSRSCRGCIKTAEYDDENDDENDEMGSDGFVLVLVLELVLENSRSCRGCIKTIEYDDENDDENDDEHDSAATISYSYSYSRIRILSRTKDEHEYDDENNKKNDDDEGGGTCRARHLRAEPINLSTITLFNGKANYA